jgi:hypothetical protein
MMYSNDGRFPTNWMFVTRRMPATRIVCPPLHGFAARLPSLTWQYFRVAVCQVKLDALVLLIASRLSGDCRFVLARRARSTYCLASFWRLSVCPTSAFDSTCVSGLPHALGFDFWLLTRTFRTRSAYLSFSTAVF